MHEDDLLFWVSIVALMLALSVVVVDWYFMHLRLGFPEVHGIVNRVFAFFCLAMLSGNAIIVSKAEYYFSIQISIVVILTETLFLLTNKVNK